MEHAYTTESGHAGIWKASGDRIYCRWQWDRETRELVVEAGEVTRSWTTPELDHRETSGIRLDLPETARDIAHLIERQGTVRIA